jgi:hypothetical protein
MTVSDTSGAAPPPTAPSDQSVDFADVLFERDLNEVQLLIEYISGRSDQNLDLLVITDPGDPTKQLHGGEVAQRVAAIRYSPPTSATDRAVAAAMLWAAKDGLNRLTDPARGLTIAYTAMFGGAVSLRFRNPFNRRSERLLRESKAVREDLETLAFKAFPLVEWHVRRFNFVFGFISFFAVVWFLLTSFTYWDVATGLTAVQRVDQIDNDYAQFSQANPAFRVDACLSAQASDTGAVCNRYFQLQSAKSEANSNLLRFISCSDSRCFAAIHVLRWSFVVCGVTSVDGRSTAVSDSANPSYPLTHTVGSILSVFSTYVLPMMFGLLGTSIAVIRTVQREVQRSELGPSDMALALISLPVGAVAGVAVGLFFSPTGATVPGTVGNLTLTTSGLGFLAGYGAEAFFRFVDFQIIERVFRATDPRKSQPPPSPGPRFSQNAQ